MNQTTVILQYQKPEKKKMATMEDPQLLLYETTTKAGAGEKKKETAEGNVNGPRPLGHCVLDKEVAGRVEGRVRRATTETTTETTTATTPEQTSCQVMLRNNHVAEADHDGPHRHRWYEPRNQINLNQIQVL